MCWYVKEDGNSDSVEKNYPGNITSSTVSALIPGTTYCLQVRANGDEGVNYVDSEWSNIVEITTDSVEAIALDRPNLTIDMNKSTPDNIVVTWDAVQNASSYEISYAVKWDSTNGFVYDKDLAYIKEDVSASKTSYAFKQILDPSAGYYIKIQAKGDNATYSDSVWGSETATTKDLTQLTAPNVTASSTATVRRRRRSPRLNTSLPG